MRKVIDYIINTIGTIDDLIEKYDNMINKSEKKILLQYELDTIKNLNIYSLNEIVKVIDNRGKTPPLVNNSNGHPIIEVAQLAGENMIIDSNSFEKYVSDETYSSFFRNGHLLKKDVLISTVGTIGVAAYNFEDGLSIAQNVVALRSDYSYYIYCYLINKKKEILNLDIGGVQPSIKIPHLLNQKMKIPFNNNIQKYETIFNEINKINKKKQLLIMLKKQYLKKYFS